MYTLEEEKKEIIKKSKKRKKSKNMHKRKRNKESNIIIIVKSSLIIIFIFLLIMVYFYFYYLNVKSINISTNKNFIEQKTFALNINNDGNISHSINEGFDYIKKIKSIFENGSYTIFKYIKKTSHNTSKSQIEFSKKVNSTDKFIDTLYNNNANSKVMYVLASFIVPKFKINNYNKKQIKVKESYQNMLREVDKNNNGDKKENFNKIFEQIGFYVPNDIIYGGRIDLTFEIDKKYHIENIEILKNEIFNSTYISYTKSSNIIKSMEMFDNFACNVIGGGIKTFCEDKNLSKWYESLTFENSEIILYDNLESIGDFLDNDLKKIFYDLFNTKNKKI